MEGEGPNGEDGGRRMEEEEEEEKPERGKGKKRGVTLYLL